MPMKLLADPLHTSLDIRFSHHLPSDCQAEQVHILHPPSEHRSPQRHSAVPLSVLSIAIRHSHHSHGGHRCTAQHVISHMATQEEQLQCKNLKALKQFIVSFKSLGLWMLER